MTMKYVSFIGKEKTNKRQAPIMSIIQLTTIAQHKANKYSELNDIIELVVLQPLSLSIQIYQFYTMTRWSKRRFF